MSTFVTDVQKGLKSLGKRALFAYFALLIAAILVIDGAVKLFAGDLEATLLIGAVILGGGLYFLNEKGKYTK